MEASTSVLGVVYSANTLWYKDGCLIFPKTKFGKIFFQTKRQKKKKQNKTKTTSTRKPKFVKQTFLVENLLVLCIHELNE